jgi:hypothetical protein
LLHIDCAVRKDASIDFREGEIPTAAFLFNVFQHAETIDVFAMHKAGTKLE